MTGALFGALLVILPQTALSVAALQGPNPRAANPVTSPVAGVPKLPSQRARVPFVLDTAAALGDVTATLRWEEGGRLRSVRGTLGYLASGIDAPAEFLVERSSVLGLTPAERWWVAQDERDANGNRHVLLQREAFGAAVVGDWVRLHAGGDRQVHGIELGLTDLSGFHYDGPRVSPWEAVTLARRGFEGDLSEQPRPTLVIVSRRPGGAGALAYHVRIAHPRRGRIPFVRDVFISADNGGVIREQSRIYTQAATMPSMDLLGSTVQLNVTVFPQSVLLQDRVSLPNGGEAFSVDASRDYIVYDTPNVGTPFADATAVTAHDAMGRVLDYFQLNHGWQNWNFAQAPAGSGGLLAAYVHEGDELNNAFFTTASSNGDVFGIMAFGDGDGVEFDPLPLCFDVTGHEMGHGVVQGTADLAYQFQSGALNEHYADVFGWLSDPGDDLIGEDCVGPALLPALRNMCDPPSGASPQPDHMNDYEDLPNTEEGDWGGVHVNSGIPNRAACVARGTLGATKLGDVWFQALRFHLGPDSTFSDMVDATSAACGELGTTTGQDCADVAQAWISVGLGTSGSGGGCPANSTLQDGACFCDAGFVPNAAGDACEPEASISCPPNSSAIDGDCYCDAGYVPTADASECVPESQGPCPLNSHREGGVCVCDDCFQGNPERSGYGCDAIPGCVACPDPLEVDGGAGACVCVGGITFTCGPQSANYDFEDPPGTIVRGEDCCQESDPCGWADDGFCDCFGECTFDTVDCAGASTAGPVCRGTIPGDCGEETWAGRCDGTWLVYCDDVTAPANPVVKALDCDVLGEVCAWETDIGFTCVDPTNNCGSVPDTGFCNGNIAQYCEDGVLMEVDCGNKPCGERMYQGETLQFCLPCPANATLFGLDCICDTGFEPDSTATQCVPIPDPMPMPCACDTSAACDTDCTCDTDCLCPCDTTTGCDANCTCDPECSGGGCAAVPTETNHAGLWLWLVGLGLLWRQRRSG